MAFSRLFFGIENKSKLIREHEAFATRYVTSSVVFADLKITRTPALLSHAARTLPRSDDNEKVIEVFSHARLRHQDGSRTDAAGGSSVTPVGGGGGGSGASPYYPRAAVAAAATAAAGLDTWGIGGGLKEALSSASGIVIPAASKSVAVVGTGGRASSRVGEACRSGSLSTDDDGSAAAASSGSAGPAAAAATGERPHDNDDGSSGRPRLSASGNAGPGSAAAAAAAVDGVVDDSARDTGGGGGDCDDDDDDGVRGRARRGPSLALEGALALTTHRMVFVERLQRRRRRRRREPEGIAKDEGSGGDDDDAGRLVEIPLAYIVDTKVRRRPSEGLVGVQV